MTSATTSLDWLKDTTRSNPKVLTHLAAENTATDAALAPLKPLQDALVAEFTSRAKIDQKTSEIVDGPYAYFTELDATASQPRHLRRHIATDTVEVLLDEEIMARGGFLDLGQISISDDHALIAWTEDRSGDEQYTLIVRNIATGETLATIDEVAHAVEFNIAGTKVAYTTKDDAQRVYRVWSYDIASETSTLLYEETDERFLVGLGVTRDEQWLTITSDSHEPTTEVRLVERHTLTNPTLFSARVPAVAGWVDSFGGYFWILTNYGRRDFRLMTGTPGQTPDQWTDVYTPEDGVTLADMELFTDHVAFDARYNGFNRVAVAHRTGNTIHDLTWLGSTTDASTVHVDQNPEPASGKLRINVSGWTTPDTEIVYTLNFDGTPASNPVVDWTETVPGYDPTQYESTLEWATSPDGTRVPYSVMRRIGMPVRGTHLWAYGSYGHSDDPEFISTWVSLLDRGIAAVAAFPRGGGELGRAWHDNGKLEHKQNTFIDMEAVARDLHAKGYAPIVLRGGSAGGLMVGATINRAPELFTAAIAEVPFVDCLNTMLDDTLPLTIGEYDEWGNPNEPDVYDRIKAYAPVENVAPANYPAVYATAGLHDPRVGYWEPAKWVQRLREDSTSGKPVLFRCEMNGHGGATGRWDKFAERAEAMAFAINQIDLAQQ